MDTTDDMKFLCGLVFLAAIIIAIVAVVWEMLK